MLGTWRAGPRRCIGLLDCSIGKRPTTRNDGSYIPSRSRLAGSVRRRGYLLHSYGRAGEIQNEILVEAGSRRSFCGSSQGAGAYESLVLNGRFRRKPLSPEQVLAKDRNPPQADPLDVTEMRCGGRTPAAAISGDRVPISAEVRGRYRVWRAETERAFCRLEEVLSGERFWRRGGRFHTAQREGPGACRSPPATLGRGCGGALCGPH